MIDKKYSQQVQMLLEILPYVMTETCFALKGGTAINFLVQDMPRLSVDIDLIYLPKHPRTTAIREITAALHRIKKLLSNQKFQVSDLSVSSHEFKLFVTRACKWSIKIEVNPMMRESLYPIEKRDIVNKISDMFQRSILDVPMLCIDELYGSKIVAALDRQHPRDLFDVHMMYQTMGITEKMKNSFIVYLLSSKKTHELFNPTLKDLTSSFKNQFQGMTEIPITLEELLLTRDKLMKELKNQLTEINIDFIASFLRGAPKWELFEIMNIDELPAIKWKLQNIKKMSDPKRNNMVKTFLTDIQQKHGLIREEINQAIKMGMKELEKGNKISALESYRKMKEKLIVS